MQRNLAILVAGICIVGVFVSLLILPNQSVSLRHWKQASNIGDSTLVVTIDPAFVRDRATYDDATSSLFEDGKTYQIGFFLPSDRYPADMSREQFAEQGQWAAYRPLAIYARDGFSAWDCERAGAEAAPLDALCGKGVKDDYDAILDLASRDGWVTGCSLPFFGGKAVVDAFVKSLPNDRKDQFLQAYENMYADSISGPDDPADCNRLRAKIVGKALKAKRHLLDDVPFEQRAEVAKKMKPLS